VAGVPPFDGTCWNWCTFDKQYLLLQPLAVPGRVLVGEGVLTKMCRKKPKSRQFFLFNDILVYGNIVINKKKVSCFVLVLTIANVMCALQYNKQHIIPLEEVKLESLEDDGREYRSV
jgi:hypothetical protein